MQVLVITRGYNPFRQRFFTPSYFINSEILKSLFIACLLTVIYSNGFVRAADTAPAINDELRFIVC